MADAHAPHVDGLTVSLDGRVAVVTGSTGGIGRGIALALARNGAAVVVNGRRAREASLVAREIEQAGGRATVAACDVGEAETADALVTTAVDTFGRLDILVNNAALTRTFGDFLSFTDERIDEIVRVNLRGAVLCAQRAARYMAAHGGGSIVNVTSVGGSQRAHHQNVVYDVTKGGLDALTRALATDLGPLGVRVNAVGPAATNDDPSEARGEDLPLRRGGTSADVAAAVLFFVSDPARFVTGQILYVDGGLTAQLRSPGRQRPAQVAAS